MENFPGPENSPATGQKSQKEVLSDQSRNLIWILQSKLMFFAILESEWVVRAISRDQKFSPHRKYIKLIYFKEENEWKSNISQDPPFLFVSVSWFSVGFLWVPPLQGFRGFPQVSFVFLWFPWPSRNSFLFENSWKKMVFRLCKNFPWGKINKIGTKISNRKKRKKL